MIKHDDMVKLASYQKELRKNPRLRTLFFELTDACNLHCIHCGSSCTGNSQTQLDDRVIERTLRNVAGAYGTDDCMICLTGGEPLLYPRLYNVIAYARALGFSVGITTNGTLITPFAARQLARNGLDTVAISLDGIGETHDAFRGTKGCFLRALDGIRALKTVGIEPEILTVVHKNNLFQLDDMYSMLSKMDIYSWRVVNMDPIGRANAHTEELLNGEELERLYGFIREKRFDPTVTMEISYGCAHFVTYKYEREIRDYYFQCGAGTQVASVAANGDILACLDIGRRSQLVQGNVYKDDFVSIWEHGFQQFRTDRTKHSKTCRTCEHRKICMGDAAHTWDYDHNKPLYCTAKMLQGKERRT